MGWHVYHNISFSLFYRADQDLGEMSHHSDFIKLVAYNNCAGPRFRVWVENAFRVLLADATPAEAYPLLLRLLGLHEAALEEIPNRGFSSDYVRRETERAVADVGGRCAIYPVIDIDIPTEPARCSRERVRDAARRVRVRRPGCRAEPQVFGDAAGAPGHSSAKGASEWQAAARGLFHTVCRAQMCVCD